MLQGKLKINSNLTGFIKRGKKEHTLPNEYIFKDRALNNKDCEFELDNGTVVKLVVDGNEVPKNQEILDRKQREKELEALEEETLQLKKEIDLLKEEKRQIEKTVISLKESRILNSKQSKLLREEWRLRGRNDRSKGSLGNKLSEILKGNVSKTV